MIPHTLLAERERMHFPLKLIGLIGMLLWVGVLAAYNLEGYPAFTSLDEAYRLMLSRSLAVDGQWGVGTYEGLSPFWHDSTGPTVLLPIAVAFRVFGVSLVNARAVMGVYLMIAVAALYLCTQEIYGEKVAAAAVWMFLFLGPTWLNTAALGRSVYGEVPGLAFLFLGAFFWFRALQNDKARDLMAASLCFSGAVLTKNLLLLGIVATMAVLFVIDLLWLKTLKWRHVTVPTVSCLAVIVFWAICQSLLNGTSSGAVVNPTIAGFLLLSRHSDHLAVLWYENLKFLAEQNVLLWGAPAIFYCIASAFQRSHGRATVYQLFFPLFVVSWFGWYAFISIGWPRYAYPGWAVMSVLTAKFFIDLAGGTWKRSHNVYSMTSTRRWHGDILGFSVWLLLIMLLLWPAQNTFRRIVNSDNEEAQAFATYLDARITLDSRILSGEWDVAFFSKHRFVPIPSAFITNKIDCEQLGIECNTDNAQAFSDLAPDYIVSGPENRHLQYVPSDLLEHRCKLVVSMGEYHLYDTRDRCYLKRGEN